MKLRSHLLKFNLIFKNSAEIDERGTIALPLFTFGFFHALLARNILKFTIMDFDFGELKNDSNFTSKVQASNKAVSRIEKFIKDSAEMKIDELSPEDRVKYDLFLIYAVNSLYWMYLKIDGDNPNAVSR